MRLPQRESQQDPLELARREPPPSLAPDWLHQLAQVPEWAPLVSAPAAEQARDGYAHTLREILQQPTTWLEAGSTLQRHAAVMSAALDESAVGRQEGALVITGSGSSLYAGECQGLALQQALQVPVSVVPAGLLLTHPNGALPPRGPFLLVSIARSGDSPESGAVVENLLRTEPRARHLVITCNREGRLARVAGSASGVRRVVLDDRTNDRSLVMTSSFTNLALATAALGWLARLDELREQTQRLARCAARLLLERAAALAGVARSRFRSAVYLGSGCHVGAAREAALKMMEMTAGRVFAWAESYLGLRHGPMSAIQEDTLVVASLSAEPLARAYELDLLREIDSKGVGLQKVLVGHKVPAELASRAADVVVELEDAGALVDAQLAILDVVVGQILAFFRCRHEGLRPDAPSTAGIISRVVEDFAIYPRP
jgi:tagatose-6-phosphate ketose/aldose isomerase